MTFVEDILGSLGKDSPIKLKKIDNFAPIDDEESSQDSRDQIILRKQS